MCLDHYWEDQLVNDSETAWENITHDWAASVDHEHGVPTTDLTPIVDDGTSGITVQFQPDVAILLSPEVMTSDLNRMANWPQLRVEFVDERPQNEAFLAAAAGSGAHRADL
jgi:hypothetical protein